MEEHLDRISIRRLARIALLACALGLLLRLLIAWISIGTNDAFTWFHFGTMVEEKGLARSYLSDRLLNHPPLPVMWAWACRQLSGEHFAFLFKLAPIAADGLACWVLWRIGMARRGPRLACAMVVAMALNPVAILVSAYHCNTDNLYAALSLLAFYFALRRRALLAGLALGAAINVKLIPALLVPALLAGMRSARDQIRILAGLAIMGLIFIWPAAITEGRALGNMINYASNDENWGIVMILRAFGGLGVMPETLSWAAALYFQVGKWLMLGALVGAAALARHGKDDPLQSAALASAIFLTMAPGFGVQYLVYPSVLLTACSLRWGWVFNVVGGAFLVAAYCAFILPEYPLRSKFTAPIPVPASTIGLGVWTILSIFVVVSLLSCAKTAPAEAKIQNHA